MYGEPLKPKECEFTIFIDNGDDDSPIYIAGDGDICLLIYDITDPSNDDVREIDHPEFDTFWGNAMENTFLSNGFDDFKSLKEAKDWCLSIGMKEKSN